MTSDKEIIDRQRSNFIAFMQKHKLKASPWAKKAGIAEATIRHYLSGQNQSLTSLNLEKLANAARVKPNDLINNDEINSNSVKNDSFSIDKSLMAQAFIDAEEFIAQSGSQLSAKDRANTLITWYELAQIIRNDHSLNTQGITVKDLIKKIAS